LLHRLTLFPVVSHCDQRNDAVLLFYPGKPQSWNAAEGKWEWLKLAGKKRRDFAPASSTAVVLFFYGRMGCAGATVTAAADSP
jgi:hypothetical protein